MSSEWYDELSGGGSDFADDPMDGFYCPYTNGAECVLFSKGWQPQELCDVLECEQLKRFERRNKNRSQAA